MTLTDLIIIYLACGSPFGVYQITKRGSRNWSVVLASFLFWPGFAIALLIDWYGSSSNEVERISDSRIEYFRVAIENAAFFDGSAASVFEFRDVFYRFTGLSEAANVDLPAKPRHELFDIARHNNGALASKCLARRNQQRLIIHQDQARSEFVDIIGDLTLNGTNSEEIVILSMELAEHLNDMAARNELNAVLFGGRKNKPAFSLEKKLSRSRVAAASASN